MVKRGTVNMNIKMNTHWISLHKQRGAVGLMVTLLIPVFIGMAALTIAQYGPGGQNSRLLPGENVRAPGQLTW